MKRFYAVLTLFNVLVLLLFSFGAQAEQATPWNKIRKNVLNRFVEVPGSQGQAIVDLETRIVWQKMWPLNAYGSNYGVEWDNAHQICAESVTGGRVGWRLPTYEEFQSLLVALPNDPIFNRYALPTGHPFTYAVNPLPAPARFWTTTTVPYDTAKVFTVNPNSDIEAVPITLAKDGGEAFVVCVRGGSVNSRASGQFAP